MFAKIFTVLFVTIIFTTIFALATLGARKSRKEWSEILGENKTGRDNV